MKRKCGPFTRIELPRFSVTNHGVECRFPIIEWNGLTIAVLLCHTRGDHLGLLLFPSNDPIQDPSRKKYYVGYGFWQGSDINSYHFARLIPLGTDFYELSLRMNGIAETVGTAVWRDIFIVDTSSPIEKDAAPSLCFPLHAIEPAPPFRLPHWLIGRMNQTGLELRPLKIKSWPAADLKVSWLIEVIFADSVELERLSVVLGTCTKVPGTLPPWAKALCRHGNKFLAPIQEALHDCDTDHIEGWPEWMKDFGDDERNVRLSFTRCKIKPDHTLVAHIELKGSVYDALKEQNGVELPSRQELEAVETASNSGTLPPPNQPTAHAVDSTISSPLSQAPNPAQSLTSSLPILQHRNRRNHTYSLAICGALRRLCRKRPSPTVQAASQG